MLLLLTELSETRGVSRTSTASQVELSATITNTFQPLTNVKKNFNFLCGRGYPPVNTVKLRKTLKNMSNALAKIVKNSIFSKIKFALPVY